MFALPIIIWPSRAAVAYRRLARDAGHDDLAAT
jgi:hypothetical protein